VTNDGHVSVDSRALIDLRSRTQSSEAAAQRATQQIAQLENELASMKVTLDEAQAAFLSKLAVAESKLVEVTSQRERAYSESASLSEQLDHLEDDLERREAVNRVSSAELTEALRQAQARYWTAAEELKRKSAEHESCADELAGQLQKVASLQRHAGNLTAQLNRITGSKAWRLISAYRRTLNLLLRRSR